MNLFIFLRSVLNNEKNTGKLIACGRVYFHGVLVYGMRK